MLWTPDLKRLKIKFFSQSPWDPQIKILWYCLWLLLITNLSKLCFISVGLKVHRTNNLKFVILSCGYRWFQMSKLLVNLHQWKYIYDWNMVYVQITFDIHSNSFIWMYKIHANDVFFLSWLYIQHIFKSENFQSWSAFGREFCLSNFDNQAPWDKKHETENHSPLSQTFQLILLYK